MTTGEILAELRRDKNIGQKELATFLRVSVGTVSNYENDVHAPDLRTLCRLADFFDRLKFHSLFFLPCVSCTHSKCM